MTRASAPSIAPATFSFVFACALALALLASGCPNDPDPPPAGWTDGFDASNIGWFLSVWGPASDDLYTVGGTPRHTMAGADVSGAPAMMHFDGDAWAPVDLSATDAELLNWVYGFGPSDLTTVGEGGKVLHYDGSAWTEQATPTDQTLWGVWGAAPDDLWAVGGNGRMDGQATILRFDGTTWTEVTLPTLARANVWALFKVWGTSADNVIIVGQRGAILHWNGTELLEEDAGTTNDLISVWGTGAEHIAVAGGRSNGVIAVYDGTAWRSGDLTPLPGLNGVWVRDPDVIHVVGVEGTVATVDFTTLEVVEDPQDTRLTFHAIFGDGARLTTVGGNLSSPSPPFRGIAMSRVLVAGE